MDFQVETNNEKVKKYQKENVMFLVKYIIIAILLGIALYVGWYFYESPRKFGKYVESAKVSKVLKKEFGEIKDVKLNNFFDWTTEESGHTCVKMVVITTNNIKYDVCTIVDEEERGYIIDMKIVYESK